MGKMILITTDNEVKELEYPDAGLKSCSISSHRKQM